MEKLNYMKLAKSRLKNNWDKGVISGILYCIIVNLCWILSGPMLLGTSNMFLNIAREKKASVKDIFSGFDYFGRSFILDFVNSLFIFFWSLLLIIPGIIKSFAYSMSFFILSDNPDMSSSEARKESIDLMRGHKGELFCLYLKFIGWNLLSLLTLGILSLFVFPYMETAVAIFYDSLLPKQEETKSEDTPFEETKSLDDLFVDNSKTEIK